MRPPLCEQTQPSYLLHGFDTGTGTSTRCPVPRRSPRRWADTGLCCPIWACRPLPPSPSSPGRCERGSVHPDPGLGSWMKISPCWRLAGFRNWNVWPLSWFGLAGSAACTQRRRVVSLAASSRCEFYPSCTTLERGWDIYADLWHRSYQPLITVCCVLCNVSYFREVWPFGNG